MVLMFLDNSNWKIKLSRFKPTTVQFHSTSILLSYTEVLDCISKWILYLLDEWRATGIKGARARFVASRQDSIRVASRRVRSVGVCYEWERNVCSAVFLYHKPLTSAARVISATNQMRTSRRSSVNCQRFWSEWQAEAERCPGNKPRINDK